MIKDAIIFYDALGIMRVYVQISWIIYFWELRSKSLMLSAAFSMATYSSLVNKYWSSKSYLIFKYMVINLNPLCKQVG